MSMDVFFSFFRWGSTFSAKLPKKWPNRVDIGLHPISVFSCHILKFLTKKQLDQKSGVQFNYIRSHIQLHPRRENRVKKSANLAFLLRGGPRLFCSPQDLHPLTSFISAHPCWNMWYASYDQQAPHHFPQNSRLAAGPPGGPSFKRGRILTGRK